MAKADTKTKTQTTPQVETAESKGEVAVLKPPRLPMPDNLEGEYGLTGGQWRTLIDAIYPAAKSTDSVCLVLDYCKARKLDPFKRVAHIVPIWDNEERRYKEAIWPAIADHRTTAFRTGEYAGCDPTDFGTDITQEFEGPVGKDRQSGEWKRATVNLTFPEYAQITVYRMLHGTRVPIPGPRVYWLETYGRRLAFSDVPNDKWSKSPSYMLEKCAEAAALRKAFPEELGQEGTAEEMEGQFPAALEVHDEPPRPQRSEFIDASDEMDEAYAATVGPADEGKSEQAEAETPQEQNAPDSTSHDPETGELPMDTPTPKQPPHVGEPPDWLDLSEVGSWQTDVHKAIDAAPDVDWLNEFSKANAKALTTFREKYPKDGDKLQKRFDERRKALAPAEAAE